MNILKNISIPAKITLGFGTVIFALLVVAAVGIYNLTNANNNYVEYRSLARQTNEDGRVQANMLMTRIFAKDFVIKPTEESIQGVNQRARATIELINGAQELSDNVAFQVMLDSILKDLEEYVLYFGKVTDLQNKRNELVLNKLNVVGPETERNLTDIMKSALEDGDTEASYLAGLALRSLLLGRLYANRFLIQNDTPSYDRARSEFSNMENELDALDKSLEKPERQALLKNARENKAEYLESFTQVQRIILERNDIIRNYLDRIGPDVAEEIEKLKLAIKSEQDKLGPKAQAALETARWITIIFTIIAVLFGVMAAWIIGKGITKPLRQLTVAADAMSRGELEQDIDTDREDEIGKLALAFVTMRKAIQDQVSTLKSEIDERQKAEQEAAERRQVFMDAVDPIVIEDLDGLIVDLNQEAVRAYGYPRDVLIGEPVTTLIPEQFHAQAEELFTKSKAGFEVRNIETYRWNNKQEIIPVELTFSQLRDEHNRITALATMAKDITKEREIQEELDKEREALEVKVVERTAEAETARIKAEELRDEAETATKAKANFLAAMSHEIRTPMNGIIGMVDLLRQSDLSKEHHQMLQTINDSGQSLVTIINDILDFSKIEAGKLELESIPFNLLEIVEGSATTLTPLIQEKNLGLLLYVDPKIPQFITGDPGRVRQILMNLGSNAVKFTETGEIEIRAELIEINKKVTIRFRVIDQGIGVSEEAQKSLFKAFSQAESSTTRKYGGTGLGLSICQHLSALMNGEVTVNSKLGKGSEFTFTIPFEPSDKQIKLEKQDDLKGINVLLIGKHEKEQFICRTYLEHWHAKVDIAKKPDIPIKSIKDYLTDNKNLDLIIIGSSWDRETQIEIRDAIHKEPEYSDIKIILLMQGKRHQPRLNNPETVSLDVNPLKRITFLAAVSIATGRASPEIFHSEEIEDLKANKIVLNVEDAIKNNALILVAEDNPTNRDVIGRQLKLLGYTCEMADDGKLALEAWQSGRYFILLTDCHMPEMDGYDLTGAIRHQEKGSGERAPIIAITANALQGEADRCFAAGMDDYMSKPVDMKDLRDKLRRWLPHFKPVNEKENKEISGTKKSRSNGPNDIPIDENKLKQMFGDDQEMFKEILNDFVQPSRDIIEEMKAAYKQHSYEGINQAAHKLKSSASSVGANELADLCNLLEKAGIDENWDTIENNVPSVDTIMNAVESYINEL
jgi:PAS domain S-box-containing protein